MKLSESTLKRDLLDVDQDRAVVSKESRIAVVAGPGSGKTRTLVARARFLLDEGVDPSRIVVITFTNSAAGDLRSRIGPVTLGFVGTLHAFCLDLIRRHHLYTGLGPDVAIALDKEREITLRNTCKRLGVKYRAAIMEGQWADGREELAFKEYRFSLRQAGMLDFDMILDQAAHVAPRLTVEETAIDHLLIDEAQDSGDLDWAVYAGLWAKNIFVVGDPDQSIYAFRGARPEHFQQFCRDAKTLVLERSYRSSPPVCLAASHLIAHNGDRIPKSVVPALNRDGLVAAKQFQHDHEEAYAISRWILGEAGVQPNLEAYGKFAVLCPTNEMVVRTRTLLQGLGVPCRQPKARQYATDLAAAILLLAWAVQPGNDIRGEIALRTIDWPNVSQHASTARLKGTSLAHVADIHFPANLDRVDEYLARMSVGLETRELIAQKAKEVSSLPALLLALTNPDDDQDEGQGVHVMTIHRAKGLEFDNVAVVGLEEGSLPGLKADRLEEWRRLAFVAMTRARHDLLLCSSTVRRTSWGEQVLERPSRFVREAGL